jgi:hypothetical protein
MARIESYTLEQIGLTVHRVCGELQGHDLRRTGKRFYAQGVTPNVLWDFSGADLTQIASEEIIRIVGEVKAYAHSREGGRTAFVLTADVNFGLGRMVEMASESMDMPFVFRSFRSLEEAAAWLGIDPAAICALFQEKPSV